MGNRGERRQLISPLFSGKKTIRREQRKLFGQKSEENVCLLFVETTADCLRNLAGLSRIVRTREKGEIGGVEKEFECPLWVSQQYDDGGKKS